jgi:hypothetical protein
MSGYATPISSMKSGPFTGLLAHTRFSHIPPCPVIWRSPHHLLSSRHQNGFPIFVPRYWEAKDSSDKIEVAYEG